MTPWRRGLACAVAMLAVGAAGIAPLRADEIRSVLSGLRPTHPRILISAERVKEVQAEIASDPVVRARYHQLEERAGAILAKPLLSVRFLSIKIQGTTPSLIPTVREAIDRISTLSFLWLVGGDRRFAERGREELLVLAALPDWNASPYSFLDTAELGFASALGYDWLFDYLGEADKAQIRAAIVSHALRPGLEAYRTGAWWTKVRFNWNLVCNSGLVIAALAVADDSPDLAAEIVEQGVQSARLGFSAYGPDGGYAEGPGYWSYATIYAEFLTASLQSALRQDFGLSASPGFARTGDFILHMTGPTGLVFNFGDGPDIVKAQHLSYIASRFGRPIDQFLADRDAATSASVGFPLFPLLWRAGRSADPLAGDAPLDARFGALDIVSFRGAWLDPNAVFVAVKGGDNTTNHADLDLGTFVLDAAGQRWAIDLGPDDYSLPGYFGARRFSYYRKGTAGQNTLTIDGGNQRRDAKAAVKSFVSTPQWATAVVDLSAAYGQMEGSIARGVALIDRKLVLVQDEIGPAVRGNIVWAMHTRAQIQLVPHGVILEQQGARLVARILAPADAGFEIVSARRERPEDPNDGISKLSLVLPQTGDPRRISILFFETASDEPIASGYVRPLSDWIAGSFPRDP